MIFQNKRGNTTYGKPFQVVYVYVFTDSRFCHIQYGDLEDHIHNYDGKTPHNAWNEEEYNAHKIQEEFREDEMDIEMAEVDFALNLFNEYGDPTLLKWRFRPCIL